MEPTTTIVIPVATIIGKKLLENLAIDIVKKSGSRMVRQILGTDKEKAIRRCLEQALIAFLSTTTVKEKPELNLLDDIFRKFFRDAAVIDELALLLQGERPERVILREWVEKEGFILSQLSFFDFEKAMDAFERMFVASAVAEESLQNIVQTHNVINLVGISEQQLATLQKISDAIVNIQKQTLQIRDGNVTGVDQTTQKPLSIPGTFFLQHYHGTVNNQSAGDYSINIGSNTGIASAGQTRIIFK